MWVSEMCKPNETENWNIYWHGHGISTEEPEMETKQKNLETLEGDEQRNIPVIISSKPTTSTQPDQKQQANERAVYRIPDLLGA